LVNKKSGISRRGEPRGIPHGATNAERRGWRGVHETIKEKDFAVRRRRRQSYISSRGPRPSPCRPLGPSYPASSHTATGTKAASFEGGSETKREPANTACNRVNCAAYAFISLFRDNLLIVSTKRDNPLVAVCPGRFFGGCEGDLVP